MKRPLYKHLVAWIVESWAAVNENCVRNGFIKARGDEAVSGDSDCVHDDTFSKMEAEEIPKEILNAIDSFNIESNEEFLDLNSVMCI
jgi:hypothetical protein